MNRGQSAGKMDLADAAARLAAVGRELHARGWVPATSGNFSVRLGDGDIAITASGRDKSRLRTVDVLRLSLDGSPRGHGRPSSEAGLHLQLYRRDPSIGAVLHTHSLNAVLATAHAGAALKFTGLELLKAFPGVQGHDETLSLPVFDNDQDISALAARVETHMTDHAQGHAYLIRGHGLYTWGRSLEDCLRHLEALEYLIEYHLWIASAERTHE